MFSEVKIEKIISKMSNFIMQTDLARNRFAPQIIPPRFLSQHRRLKEVSA